MQNDKYRETKNRYDKENMKGYSVNMPLSVYNEMMKEVEKNNTNRNAYTIQAIKEKIEKGKENEQ